MSFVSTLVITGIMPIAPDSCANPAELGSESCDFQRLIGSQVSLGGQWLGVQIISELRALNRIFNLRHPLAVRVAQGTYWTHESEELVIFGCGKNESESLLDFATSFAISWDGLADEPDEKLTVDARLIRDRLKSYVHDVESVL